MENTIELLCDSANGVYIPQIMIPKLIKAGWENLPQDAGGHLDPSCEWYWDNWDEIEQCAEYLDDKGFTWYLYQDGDLFAYREDHIFDDQF